MKHKEIVRELIAVGISLNIREINYNEAVALINKNLLEYSKLNNLALSGVGKSFYCHTYVRYGTGKCEQICDKCK